jgi:hypothetical protein
MRPFYEPNDPKEGYVYILHTANDIGGRHPTKIGFCHYRKGEHPRVTVDKRLDDIQRHHWEMFGSFNSLYIHDANVVEHIIHCKYEKYRIRGEWFNLTFKQILNIKKYIRTQQEEW